MEPKKISFGFAKLSKKSNIVSTSHKSEEKKVDLIDRLEGQSIKIKDAVEEVYEPLVIPLKDNQKNLLDRIREMKKKEKATKDEQEDTRPDSELTPDELAARELLKEAKSRLTNEKIDDHKVNVLPITPDTISLEGEKEPTLDDYESIPIADYGFALLRGMGWKEGMPIGKNVSKSTKVFLPELRPKGLGLGASKMLEDGKGSQKALDKNEKELVLSKGGYAKVIAGSHKGNYCEIQGFDEEAGRVIVRSFPKMEVLNLNEFMLVPVTKEEFSRGSKVLNNAKYEEYKELSDIKLEKHKRDIKKEYNSDHDSKNGIKEKKYERKEYSRSSSSKKYYSSEDENNEKEKSKKNTKVKHERRSRSRSVTKHRNKKDRHHSESTDSDDYHKKEKKSSKSKHRNKSRSSDRHKKDKKHKSRREKDTNDDEVDYRRNKGKESKSKHRHSSEEDSRRSRRHR